MTDLQHTATTPELYERLINRLGLALETAHVAVRLRDEWPEELELRGLSRAEFDLIEAYLNNGAIAADGEVNDGLKNRFIDSREHTECASMPSPSAKVIWLNDRRRALTLARSRLAGSGNLFRR